MIEPAIPANEVQRLAALDKLNIVDTPLEERFDRITRMVCATLGVPMAAFSLIDETRQWQKSNQGLPGYSLDRNQSFCAHAILDDNILQVNDARDDRRFRDNPAVKGNLKVAFYAGAPVRSPDGFNVGTLCAIDTRPRNLTAVQLQVLRDLADMIETELRSNALMAENAKLQVELAKSQRLAMIDPLTHLLNRLGTGEALKRAWAEAIRKNSTVVVAILDVDHFKKINDTYGHPAGDVVLQSLARRMTSVLRVEDTVGRMGGEEFLVVLPSCKKDEMVQVLERIRQLVAALPVNSEKGDIAFTLSSGAVLAEPAKGMTIDQAINLADAALYNAKQNGRNRIEIAVAA